MTEGENELHMSTRQIWKGEHFQSQTHLRAICLVAGLVAACEADPSTGRNVAIFLSYTVHELITSTATASLFSAHDEPLENSLPMIFGTAAELVCCENRH